jgi:hypothetical protein
MGLYNSSTSNFEVVDRTNEILVLPQNWTLMNDTGMWNEEFLATRTVTFEERNGHLFIVKDQVPGTKPQTTGNDLRKLHSYPMSHHPFLDALLPQDIATVLRPGALDVQLDSKDRALMVKMERIRKSYDRTMNFARFRTVANGDIWAPNGTIAGNFYTDFGITRQNVNFDLANANSDIIDKCNQVIANFQAQGTEGQEIQRVVAYCSGGFFSALIAHPKVQAAYNLYAAVAPQQISRDRAGGMALYRRFTFSNIEFIEVTTAVDGTPLVDTDKAVFIADDGDGAFMTYFGPPNRFGYVNTTAERTYMWTYEDPRGTQVTVEAEMNMINIMRRPGFVSGGSKAAL